MATTASRDHGHPDGPIREPDFGPFTGSVASPHLATGSFTQDVMGFDVTGNFTGTLSADGTAMSVTLDLEVPFPCANSTLTGGFSRVACGSR